MLGDRSMPRFKGIPNHLQGTTEKRLGKALLVKFTLYLHAAHCARH